MIRRLVFVFAALGFALLPSLPGSAQTASADANAVALAPHQLGVLAGEYTDPKEPDTPLSFYVADGKLVVESERGLPVELTALSAVEFSLPDAKNRYRFTLGAAS